MKNDVNWEKISTYLIALGLGVTILFKLNEISERIAVVETEMEMAERIARLELYRELQEEQL